MDFDLWESSAELPQQTQNIHVRFCAQMRMSFWGQNMDFSRQKTTCGTGLRRIAAECLRIRQPTAPKKCKTDQILLACPKKHFFKICPKCLNFSRFKKVAPKVAKGFFGPMANEVACAFPKGSWWNVAVVWNGKPLGRRWHCYGSNAVDREHCKAWGWLRLLSRRMHDCPAVIQSKIQEPCNTEPAKHFPLRDMTTEKHVSNTSAHANLFGAFLGHEARKGGVAASAKEGPKPATEQISTFLF